jgi:osmotically-inducible protein OsmY
MRTYHLVLPSDSHAHLASSKEAMQAALRYPSALKVAAVKNAVAVRTDAQIKHDVMEELRLEPTIDAASIGVNAQNGTVTLSGYVDGLGEKWLIEAAARRIAGVRWVAGELNIVVHEPDMRTDDDIRRDCEHALKTALSGPHGGIKVMVSNGWVTLTGNVVEGYERWAVEEIVSHLVGVLGVNGQIKVIPPERQRHVKLNIKCSSLDFI